MAKAQPAIGYLVGKMMKDGVLAVHPCDPGAPLLTEEEIRPYVKKGWAPIRDPFGPTGEKN